MNSQMIIYQTEDGKTKLDVRLENEGIGKIEIIDLIGKTVCSFENYINSGNNSIKYSELSTLPTATYTIKVTIDNEIVSIGKFIKQ